jgi:uncharacterized protein DUF3300
MRTIVAVVTTAFSLTFTAVALPYWSEVVGYAQQSQTAKPAKSSFTPDQLDKLMAPVALYPDSLLAQMLMSAANPAKVGALGEWMASQSAKGTELQEAATKSGFDASFAALVLFPDVVHYMAGNMDWTTKVGKAFTENRSAVFDSIQRLRAQAKKMGTLKTTPQQEVETKTTSSGSEVIVIEPTNPQVVYVPQYNPSVVYTQPASTTVVVKEDDDSGAAVAAGLIGFTAGIAMGAAMDNNYYYGPYGWHGGGYMYNDAWDDYYDAREDARDDWQDHREDMYEERGDIAKERGEQRTERTETRNENRHEATQAQRDQAKTAAQNRSASGTQATTQNRTTNQESRGYARSGDQATTQRSGTKSDAFSGYSSGKSERAASQRGQKSRGSSRSGGSRRR